MRIAYFVLSRQRGASQWHRHIPGHASEAIARERANTWTRTNPDREYDVCRYEIAPAPTHSNGQARNPRRRTTR